VPQLSFGVIYLGLGEDDKCIDMLEKAIDEHSPLMAIIVASSFADPLRAHPRYRALLRKMNLEP
jgi:hypothetical protein